MPLRRPTTADLPAAAAGGLALAWGALTVGPWLLCAGIGMVAAALTGYRWPTTAAAAVLLLGNLIVGPSFVVAVVSGLLVAAYVILLDGVPTRAGFVALVAGVAAAEVVVGLVIWSVQRMSVAPSMWWSLAAALTAPLVLLMVTGRRVTATRDQPDSGSDTDPVAGHGASIASSRWQRVRREQGSRTAAGVGEGDE